MAVVRPALLIIAVLGFTPAAEEAPYSLEWDLKSDGHIVATLTAPAPNAGEPGAVHIEPLAITEFQSRARGGADAVGGDSVLLTLLAAALFGGGRDLASTAALDIHARRLWSGTEIEQLRPALAAERAEGDELAARRREVERLIALRLAGRHGHAELLPLIRPLVEHEDPLLARAAREVINELGEGAAPSPLELPPLAETLARLPADCDAVVVLEPWRAPNDLDPGLFAVRLRSVGMVMMLHASGGNIMPPDMFADLFGMEIQAEAPAALAAAIGNFRIDRLVIGLRFDDPEAPPAFRVLVESSLDPGQARRLLAHLPLAGLLAAEDLVAPVPGRIELGTLTGPAEGSEGFVAADGSPLAEREHRLLAVWIDGLPPAMRRGAPPQLLDLADIGGQLIVDPEDGVVLEAGFTAPPDQAEQLATTMEVGIERFRTTPIAAPPGGAASAVGLFGPGLLAAAEAPAITRTDGRIELRLHWADQDLATWAANLLAVPQGFDPFGFGRHPDPVMQAMRVLFTKPTAP